MWHRFTFPTLLIAIFGSLILTSCLTPARPAWTDDEVAVLRSLWIGSLPALPPDPSNRYADNPDAARLGEQLFSDTRFSANGEVACATCHHPDSTFQDGRNLAKGIGTTTRRTMPLMGTAYSPWFFWDGRKDSQWSQALGPMENPVEHGGDRAMFAHLIVQHYRSPYEAVFGPLPDLSGVPQHATPIIEGKMRANWDTLSPTNQEAVSRIFANIGKAIAAYERTLIPGPSRFDGYVEAVLNGNQQAARTIYNQDEIAGLRLFIGKGNCTRCHNGPLLTDHYFHNTGVPADANLLDDQGRAQAIQQVLGDEFNCLGKYSDAQPDDCAELRFMITDGDELIRAFKPPSLRNVAVRAPYMHAGQYASLNDVIRHYSEAPQAPNGHSELEPLHLTDDEIRQLVAFLTTLTEDGFASQDGQTP